MGRLKGELAVITGGARGIGAATVDLFVREGAKILVLDTKEVNSISSEVEYLRIDVSEETDWVKVVSYFKHNACQPTILINNAGVSGTEIGVQTPEDMSLNTWNLVHKINSGSMFLGCKYLLPLMKDSKYSCSIVNVASRSGLVGVPELSAYASSKASMINYTKSLALYCGYQGYNIRCNYVAPAAILTDMWQNIIQNPADLNKVESSIPLQRMGNPQDVAEAILYFASQDSAFVTGSGLVVDGGILAGSAASPSRKQFEK